MAVARDRFDRNNSREDAGCECWNELSWKTIRTDGMNRQFRVQRLGATACD